LAVIVTLKLVPAVWVPGLLTVKVSFPVVNVLTVLSVWISEPLPEPQEVCEPVQR
jgi:hypothetical protein